MCENNNTQRWYALQVQPKRENMVSTLLRYKGYEEYLPTYKARKEPGAKNREHLLFPGYVFCKLALTSSYGSDDGGKVVTTAGVVRLLALPSQRRQKNPCLRASITDERAEWSYMKEVLASSDPARML
jgi:transcription antitermination factor NusG